MDIHRCRFVDYTPHTITALAFSHVSDAAAPPPPALRLAVGRANGDIEIWNPRHNWTHELTLPGARGRAVEGLVWAHGLQPRLFSIGGSTTVTEWDLHTRRPRANYDCNAGVVWCVDASPKGDRLAVGCDDGSVVVVDISGGPGVLEHEFVCQRQPLRVLGLRWYDNETLVGGCADGKVRVWSAAGETRGRLVASVGVDKAKTEATLVWAVVALPAQQQYVTGDSTGAVKFWDAKTHTMVQGFSVHEADVLALARDATGTNVFSAGIDRKIHHYSAGGKRKRTWQHTASRLLHANDVRALAAHDSSAHHLLVSGGAERALVVQAMDTFVAGPYKKMLMAQQVSNVAVCGAGRLVALFHDQTVKVWRAVDGKHKLVARLALAADDNIVSVGLGAPVDGVCVLAVATVHSVRVFRLVETAHKLAVRKVRDANFDVGGAKGVWVRGTTLVVLTPEDELYTFSVGENSVELDDQLELEDTPGNTHDHTNSVRDVVFGDNVLAVLRFNRSIELVPLDGSRGRVLARLSSAVHLMAFTHAGTLAVLTDENRLYEFGMGDSLLTPWSQRNSEVMPLTFLRLDDKPQGMFAHAGKVWVYGSRWLAFFDLARNLEVLKLYAAKARKRTRDGLSIRDDPPTDALLARSHISRLEDDDDDSDDDAENAKMPFWITQKYRPILKVAPWGEDICVVEREAFALPTTSAFQTPVMRI